MRWLYDPPIGLIAWAIAYITFVGVAVLFGSGRGRYAVTASGGSLPRAIMEVLEGPHTLVLLQFPLMLLSILNTTGTLHVITTPGFGLALCAVAVATCLGTAMCRRCRVRPYLGALVAVLGAALISPRFGAALGACALVVGVPHEVGMLRALQRLSDRLPDHLAIRREDPGLAAGAMLWTAALTAIPPFLPVVLLVLTLGLMWFMYGDAPITLPKRALRAIDRVGEVWPYTWLGERSLPEGAAARPEP